MIINCTKDPNIVPISRGGTGGKTAEDARMNLGVTRGNLGVKNYITQTLTSASYTVSASTYKVVTITIPTIEGYTPIGIIGIKNGTYELGIVNFDITDSTKASIVLRNVSSNSKTFTIAVTVLYEES